MCRGFSLLSSLLAFVQVSASGCATGRMPLSEIQPMSEKVLAARKLKQPLDQHLCKAVVFPKADAGWQVQKLATVGGQGPTFLAALEALCREADGLFAEAVVDIYYVRAPSGWSPQHEIRGVAVRYEAGYTPPQSPQFAEIPPPTVQKYPTEPRPEGER